MPGATVDHVYDRSIVAQRVTRVSRLVAFTRAIEKDTRAAMSVINYIISMHGGLAIDAPFPCLKATAHPPYGDTYYSSLQFSSSLLLDTN
eukprot:scaffold74594_cov37-Attheya_sp.AAC.2